LATIFSTSATYRNRWKLNYPFLCKPTATDWNSYPASGLFLHIPRLNPYPSENTPGQISRELGSTDEASSIWISGSFRLFLSHVSAKKASVAKVKAELANYNIDAFVAHQDIEPTKEWQDVIKEALQSCHALAAFITEGFSESRWCDQEVGYVLGRGVLVVPVRVGYDPYALMGRYQGMQGLNKEIPVIARELVDILLAHDHTAGRMSEALVARFVASRKYQETRDNFPLLQCVTRWTPPLLERLRTAVRDNSQIRDVAAVVRKVETLLSTHGVAL
jgi:hypothetical protein